MVELIKGNKILVIFVAVMFKVEFAMLKEVVVLVVLLESSKSL